MAIMVTINYR